MAYRGSDRLGNIVEDVMDRVLSTLLTELDGVDNHAVVAGGIAIIGITHNVEWVDPALRRPGRLEKVIEMGLPDLEARHRLVLREFERTPFLSSSGESEKIEQLARLVATKTEGLTGAKVIAVCSEAKMRSAREVFDSEESPTISSRHFVFPGRSTVHATES